MTGGAWPAMYTGNGPGVHGVPDFFVMTKDYAPDLVFYDPDKAPPFWKDLSKAGYKSLLITPATNITLPTFPNTDMITGFPLKARTNNPYLKKLMKEHDFDGEPDVEKDMKAGKMSIDEGAKHFLKSVESRITIAKKAMENKQYDFVYVCFTETDRIQHFVMGHPKADSYLLPIYKAMDDLLRYCVSRAEKESGKVIVVSDHGSQPIKEKILLNGWMVSNGYVVLNETLKSKPEGTSSKSNPLAYTLREKAMKSGLRKAYDLLPQGAKKVVRASLSKVLSSASSEEYTRVHLFDFDMDKTTAFAAISNLNVATIWINDHRFSKGIVKAGEKGRVKKELINKIAKMKNANGKSVIEGVYDASEYYGANPPFLAPDLFVEAKSGYMLDIFNFSPKYLFMKPEGPKHGDHTRQGIFGEYPSTKNSKKMSVLDVAPLIRKYFGVG